MMLEVAFLRSCTCLFLKLSHILSDFIPPKNPWFKKKTATKQILAFHTIFADLKFLLLIWYNNGEAGKSKTVGENVLRVGGGEERRTSDLW